MWWRSLKGIIFNGIADYYEYDITFNAGDNGVLVGVDDEYSVTYEYLLAGTSLADYVPNVQANNGFEFVGYRLEGDIKVYTIEEVKAMTIESDMIFTAVYNPQLTQVIIVDTSTKNKSK